MKTLVTLAIAAASVLSIGCTPQTPENEAPPPLIGLQNGSFTADLNGFDIHYEVHGQGPALMVVPQSWGLSIAGLRGIYRPLEDRLTLVYFDPRGMGESSPVVEDADMGLAAVRQDFDALRRHLGFASVNAIGWSNGATNLALLASEKPEAVSNAIFVHGFAVFGAEEGRMMVERYPDLVAEGEAFRQKMAASSDRTDEERTAMLREMWLTTWFPAMVANPATADAMLRGLFAEAEFSWAHATYSEKDSPTFDVRDKLPAITARSLVIAGVHDMLPPSEARRLADGISGAEFEVFESSGHFAPAEETERFTKMVWEFLGV